MFVLLSKDTQPHLPYNVQMSSPPISYTNKAVKIHIVLFDHLLFMVFRLLHYFVIITLPALVAMFSSPSFSLSIITLIYSRAEGPPKIASLPPEVVVRSA